MTAESISTAECRALFDQWRLIVMGNRGSARVPPVPVSGYLFRPATTPGDDPVPRPLGEVRRVLLAVLDGVDLTDEERLVLHLYYGLEGLALPFSSGDGADVAGGRDESSPRQTCRRALAKVAAVLRPQPLGPVGRRPVVDPLLEPWFRAAAPTRAARVPLVARAYVRAVALCDGPHAGPSLAGLRHWYRNCGYADPDLVDGAPPAATGPRSRPNRNALARAAALMEISLYDEVVRCRPVELPRPAPPVPGSPAPATTRQFETVTHPALRALLADDPAPRDLLQAAEVVRGLAIDGVDVAGQAVLLLRCVRPRLGCFPSADLERLAVAVSYVAAAAGNPFLALEWLGHFLRYAGITDRTFTVLVNSSEAASSSGHHRLAKRIDRLFEQIRGSWVIADGQLPRVEHTEAEQQRLIAASFRLEHLASAQRAGGDRDGGVTSLWRSVRLASTSLSIAQRVLTDRATFPAVELPDKAGVHGGDLTWPWLVAAAHRVVAPLDRLHDQLRADGGPPAEVAPAIRQVALLSRRALTEHRPEVEGCLDDSPLYRHWHDTVLERTEVLLAG